MKPSSSKGRNPGKKPMVSSPVKSESPESKSNIVPFTGHSPVALVNQYSALGSTLSQNKPNYQSALVNQFDPYKSDYPSNSPVKYKKSSPYVVRAEHALFFIEPTMSQLKNPISLVKSYFGPNAHYPPGKLPLIFFKDILFKTESISIKPIFDPKDPSKILYHSLYIIRIISLAQWGDPPSTAHTIDTLKFSYHDYIEAWDKIFLHQTEDFSHSWFLNFDRRFNRQFPMWFGNWWCDHGCHHDLLPLQLQNAVTKFTTVMTFSEYEKRFSPTLHFMAKYKIPWILKWQYKIETEEYLVMRQFLVKWWDKFDPERVLTQFSEEFSVIPSSSKTPVSIQPVSPTPQLTPQIPQSPSSSTKKIESPSSSKKKKAPSPSSSSKAEELKELAKQLLQQAARLSTDDEEEQSSSESSSTHSHHSSPSQPPKRWADYEDSQDPYAVSD